MKIVMVNAMALFAISASLTFTTVFGDSYPTIKMDNGQIYKCVNFYEQPTFRDPSIKHKVLPNLSKLQQDSPIGFGFKGPKCPIGTVPILERPKKLKLDESTLPGDNPDPPHLESKQCIDKFQTVIDDPNKGFHGANAGIALYKPDNVQVTQWSSAFMRLCNGDESIETGWKVEPERFGDNEAHLYSSYNVKGEGCINMECYGFVQVSNEYALGLTADVCSIIGEKPFVWNLSIDKSDADGRWWLSIKPEKHQIGYWTHDLFESMNTAATQVEFGGEIGGTAAFNRQISMGNGYQASFDRSAGIFEVNVMKDGNRIVPPNLEGSSTCGDIYTVLEGVNEKNEHGIFYGGPKDPHHN